MPRKPGKDFVIHPDTATALREYGRGNKKSFEEMVAERDKLVAQGTPYWDTSCDWMYSRVARKATARKLACGGPKFPEKKR